MRAPGPHEDIACACSRGEAAAIDAFSDRYLGNIDAILAANGTVCWADDVRQILAERFFVSTWAGESRPRILD